MKKERIYRFFLIFFILFFSKIMVAQPPEKMSYQAVVRDANNSLVVNQQVKVRISIISGNPNGPMVFLEEHTPTTSSNGLATIEIGTGQSLLALTLGQLDWENDDFFLKMEVDPTGGNNFILAGIQQLLTVPYAFHSNTTSYFDYNDLSNRPAGNNMGDILYWNTQDSMWHIIPIGTPGQVLIVGANSVPQWYTHVLNNALPPSIITDSVFNITGYTMNVRATIIDPGTTGVIASGVCWSETNPSPSIGNNATTDGSGTGSYTSYVTGLKSATRYYVRAYATNSVGTSYGNVLVLNTPTHCGTVTDYDGNVYQTVYVGRQCWMKENLKTTHYADGNIVTKAPNMLLSYTVGLANHVQNPASCYYFPYHDSTVVHDRGLLYTWDAVMKGAGTSDNNPSGILGICPYGWHVPSSTEWCEMENLLNPGIDLNCSNVGWRGTMGRMMAKPQYWNSYPGDSFTPGYWRTDSTYFNATDFSVIPAGYVYPTKRENSSYSEYISYCGQDGYHYHSYTVRAGFTTTAYFWTCTSGKYRYFSYDKTGIYYGISQPSHYAYSIRCVKDY